MPASLLRFEMPPARQRAALHGRAGLAALATPQTGETPEYCGSSEVPGAFGDDRIFERVAVAEPWLSSFGLLGVFVGECLVPDDLDGALGVVLAQAHTSVRRRRA